MLLTNISVQDASLRVHFGLTPDCSGLSKVLRFSKPSICSVSNWPTLGLEHKIELLHEPQL